MTSLFPICCPIAFLALPILVLGENSNEQRLQITPEKAGTNATCPADMDPTFMKNVLDGIRGTLFPKPLPCNELDMLCRQMECCFYKNKNTPHKTNQSGGLTDDLEAVGDLAQVVAHTGLPNFSVFSHTIQIQFMHNNVISGSNTISPGCNWGMSSEDFLHFPLWRTPPPRPPLLHYLLLLPLLLQIFTEDNAPPEIYQRKNLRIKQIFRKMPHLSGKYRRPSENYRLSSHVPPHY